jgi:hypothetical protein
MAQLRGESRCSQVIEPVVHGPGGQLVQGEYRATRWCSSGVRAAAYK